MKILTLTAILALGLSIGCEPQSRNATEAPNTQAGESDVDRDNTAVNVRDRNDAAQTPINQNEKPLDVDITAEVRSRVVDTDMSTNAHNVKIITQDGKVILRGPVKSADEKSQIESIAKNVAGENNVVNELEVE